MSDTEERRRELRRAAGACAIRLDDAGKIIEFDAAAEKLFGCERQQALGRSLVELAAEAQLHARVDGLRAQEQLAGALKDLEALIYAVSHDLRAPLRHLDGFVNLLAEELGGQLSGDARHFLDVISESSLKMNRLIETLLSLSRVGTAPLNPAALDMRELVAEVVNEAMARAPGRTIDWDIGVLPAAAGDRALLKQAWACLLDNALKFTRARPVAEITVAATPSAQETVFWVRDNGAGFDMEYAGKLFSAFQRLHHDREFEGAGIGLAIVRRIIARHGGRTWAEGHPDAGATVYFSLPSDPNPI